MQPHLYSCYQVYTFPGSGVVVGALVGNLGASTWWGEGSKLVLLFYPDLAFPKNRCRAQINGARLRTSKRGRIGDMILSIVKFFS